MKREHGKNIATGICVATAFWFLMLIYAPLELYFNNKEEFWFDFWVLFPVMGVVFLAAELISVLILWLCGKKPKLYDGMAAGGFAEGNPNNQYLYDIDACSNSTDLGNCESGL